MLQVGRSQVGFPMKSLVTLFHKGLHAQHHTRAVLSADKCYPLYEPSFLITDRKEVLLSNNQEVGWATEPVCILQPKEFSTLAGKHTSLVFSTAPKKTA